MKSHNPRDPWMRLTAAARRANGERDAVAPYGFATRVAARAWTAEGGAANLFERFALRAVAVAGLLAVMSVALNFRALPGARPVPSDTVVYSDDVVLAVGDPVAVALDFSN